MNSKRIGFAAGIALALIIQLIPVPAGLSREAWILASLAVLMAAWWATEAIPIAATALVPLATFPLFGIASAGATASPYASPIVMLLLGGFIIALAIERWMLHARIALNVVAAFGSRPSAMILGFMAAAALLSMWISNTATTLMMIPIALKVSEAVQKEGVNAKMFAPALVLGIAYAASIGGLATPVGTPTNLIGIGFLENSFDRTIGFVDWMVIGVPCALVLVPAAWLILTRFAFKVDTRIASETGHQTVLAELRALGPMTTPERRVAGAFAIVALLWMGQQYVWNPVLTWLSQALDLPILLSVSNMQIAMMGAVAVFLIPSGREDGEALMDWTSTARLPWSVVVLFGGGLSLAAAIQATGLAGWLGSNLTIIADLPLPLIILIVSLLVVFLTELTSNVASVSAILPVLAALASAVGVAPELLIVPAALSASCAFMLPVATAPNAIVYASGEVSMAQMIKAGFRINLVAAPVIALLASLVGPWMYGG
ncbi:SLC13 family permease [Marinicauda sp. Alg238-R41]|uniref:SLC13 family permease n=1 Tax=Marinicauda sp. Alg238-R41 TaxID=2993447 RepID=UPI0022E95531|nr:DASS family sodium-coupled anion symporter [Marinicauda sp. Alg238-R41]